LTVSSKRPNILWLMTDEQRTDSLGCYGSSWTRTPCLDRLASEGVLFETAVTPSPVCVPARVALLSGRRPHRSGIMCNNDHEGDWQPLIHTFRDCGYQTATFGKQHYFRPDVFETTINKVLSDAVHYFHYEKGRRLEDYGAVRYPSEHRGWIFAGRFPEPPENTAEAQVVAAAQQWLDNRDPRRPFFLRVSFNGPHTPVVPPGPFDTLIDPDSIDLPEAFTPPPDGVPRWESEFLRDYQGSHRLTEDELRRAHQCYYGLVAFLDSQFEVLLAWMDERGLLDNTVIVFTSDHGTHLGDHGMVQKQTFYGPVVNVPFVFRAPGLVESGLRFARPVETLSLMPTLLDLADLPIPEECADLSLAPTLTAGQAPADRAAFSELTQATWGYRSEDRLVMVRRGPWKLSLFYDGPQTDPFSEWADAALYNLDHDPGETQNLARVPEHRGVVAELLRDLQKSDEATTR
jgi:arylsulfatase